MSNTLAVLKRIRKHRKKGAEHAFMEAERAREIQQSRVVEIEEAVASSRDNSEPTDDACWVAQEAAWRMKMEVRLRGVQGDRLVEAVAAALLASHGQIDDERERLRRGRVSRGAYRAGRHVCVVGGTRGACSARCARLRTGGGVRRC